MHMRRVSTLLVVIGLTVVACERTPTETVIADNVIVATTGCGPTDGPTVELYVMPPSTGSALPPSVAHFRVILPTSRSALRNFAMPISNGAVANFNEVSAARCNADGTCQYALTGAVTIASTTSDGPFDVELHMQFARDNQMTIHRVVDWRPRSMLCG